jgi:hypothetical protein
MAELYCSRPERHKLWGEFWWMEGKYQWVFFDEVDTSETYAEQVERCLTLLLGEPQVPCN